MLPLFLGTNKTLPAEAIFSFNDGCYIQNVPSAPTFNPSIKTGSPVFIWKTEIHSHGFHEREFTYQTTDR
jgi:hypothetical protein